MKKFNFLIFVGIAAILLSGCKSSETSEISETGVSSVSSSGSQSDSQSVVSSTSTTTSTTTSTSSSIVSSVESSSSAVVSSSTVSTSTQSSTAVESSSSTTSSEPQPVVSEPDPEPEPEPAWIETPASGTMYVWMDGISSRKQAIVGAEAVKQYKFNDAVTVTAITNTGYYKVADDEYIHQDYLSKTKYVEPEPTPEPVQPSNSNEPKTGDMKTENGKKYRYSKKYGWVICGDGSTHESAGVEPNPKYNYQNPNAY